MRHLQIRLEDGEFAAFKEKARGAGFESVQDAGRQAMLTIEWGKAEGLESGVPPKLRPLLKKFAAILASGDDPIIQAAASNVEVFFDRLKPAAGRKGR